MDVPHWDKWQLWERPVLCRVIAEVGQLSWPQTFCFLFFCFVLLFSYLSFIYRTIFSNCSPEFYKQRSKCLVGRNTHIHTHSLVYFIILLIRCVETLNHPKPLTLLLRILNERISLLLGFSVFAFSEVCGDAYLCSVVFPRACSRGPFPAGVSWKACWEKQNRGLRCQHLALESLPRSQLLRRSQPRGLSGLEKLRNRRIKDSSTRVEPATEFFF